MVTVWIIYTELAGISDEASHPRPEAIRPTASGLPWVRSRATYGSDPAASLRRVRLVDIAGGA